MGDMTWASETSPVWFMMEVRTVIASKEDIVKSIGNYIQ